MTGTRLLWAAASIFILVGCASPAWHETAAGLDAAQSRQVFAAEGLAELDTAMAGFVRDGEIVGMSTLLIQGDEEVAFNAYGVQSRSTGAPVTRDTLFRIYSMTKPITAVAMMILYEEGRWSLDDPITVHLPEMARLRLVTGEDAEGSPSLSPTSRAPTMRELMSHTAGFSYGNPADPRPANAMFRAVDALSATSMDDLVARVASAPLLAEPGTEWNYSISSDLQGAIIERLSGQPLEVFLEERLFGPLGMTDTGFTVSTENAGRLADLYITDPRTDRPVPVSEAPSTMLAALARDYTIAPSVPSAGGGLVSTIGDYARFARMLANGGELDDRRILTRESVILMGTNQVPEAALGLPNANNIAFGPALGYGLGVMVVTDPTLGHFPEGRGTMSWDGAASTWFWADPENDIVFVGMVQRMGGPIRLRLQARSRELVYSALVAAH